MGFERSPRVAIPVLVAGVGLLFTALAPSAAEIEVRHQQSENVDFGTVLSTSAPGEIPSREIRFRVRVTQASCPCDYIIDFPPEVLLEADGSGDFGEVAVTGPDHRTTNRGGNDSFDLTLAVSRVPAIGGTYRGVLPVTVTIVIDP